MKTKFDSDLPDALVKQLRIIETRGGSSLEDTRNNKIAGVFSAAGDGAELNLNQILVALWRKHDEVWKRNIAQVAIGKMVKQGRLKRVRQGFYSADV